MTKSALPGTTISTAEVTNVSPHGFWLLVDERELFIAFKDFPWFADASIRDLSRVERPADHHLYWPALDVDLAVESIEHPGKYPLVSTAALNRVREGKPRKTAGKSKKSS